MHCLASSRNKNHNHKKTANNLPRLNHLVPKERKKEKKKINAKMASQALFSRSHLNISFRSIDLFSVSCPGPFFVIKREIGTRVQRLYLSRVSAPVSLCMRVCVWVCYCAANEPEAVVTQSGWSCTLRKIYPALNMRFFSLCRRECIINFHTLKKCCHSESVSIHPEAFKWAEEDKGLANAWFSVYDLMAS